MELPVNVYLKRHIITDKLYFGKTVKTDLNLYKGSGKRWVRHYKKYGIKNIENVYIETFYNKEDLIEFCEFFSEFYDIVKSDKFMNLIPENGLDGGDTKMMNYIDVYGNIVKHIKTESNKALLDSGYVALQSNEGRKRNGVLKDHKNKNTVSVLDKTTLISKRIKKENYDSRIHVLAGSKEYYILLNKTSPKRMHVSVKVVDLDKNILVVNKEEFNSRDDLFSIYSTKGKALLSITTSGNRKGQLTCVDKQGILHNITKEKFWEQLKTYGEDRSLWPLVHHSHPEGKIRKTLNINLQ